MGYFKAVWRLWQEGWKVFCSGWAMLVVILVLLVGLNRVSLAGATATAGTILLVGSAWGLRPSPRRWVRLLELLSTVILAFLVGLVAMFAVR